MKLWTTFYDFLLPDVPGCVAAMADQALRLAAREFCERTLAWQGLLTPITTLANTKTYTMPLDADEQEMVQLLGATLDATIINVTAKDDLPADWPTNDNIARCVFTLDRANLYLLPVADAGLTLQIEAALKPCVTATGVPDELFNSYHEEIAQGAKWRLMTSQKKPYTDLALGAYHKAEFGNKCGDIAWEVARSNGRTVRRSVPRYF